MGPDPGRGRRLIGPLKALAKRLWPALRLRTILFLSLLFVAALPGVGAVFLRVYENTLVQQTEAELIAQAAVLAGAWRADWPAPLPAPAEAIAPQPPTIDLNAMPLLPAQPTADPVQAAAAPEARAAALKLAPVVREASRTTLAATRVLDAQGIVVLGGDDFGRSYAGLPEVRAALAGRTTTVLRR